MRENSAKASITVVLDESVEQWIKSAFDDSETLKDQAPTAIYLPEELLIRVPLAPIAATETPSRDQIPVSCHWARTVVD